LNIIVNSNITELIDLLLTDYQEHREHLGAFGEYTIAVPSKSIENWLTSEIVKQIGICSGIRFESLHKLLNSALRHGSEHYSGLANKRQFSAVLFKLLSGLNEKDIGVTHELAVLKAWLNAQNQAQSLAQLCHSLADTFELYQIYRPDWLDAWAQNKAVLDCEAELWQGELWRLICTELPDEVLLHRAQLTNAFKAMIEASDGCAFKGLKQLAIFGVNQLDNATLAQVELMSKQLPVSLFWQPASLALFGGEEEEGINKNLVLDQQAYFSGQELLASWGGLSRHQALLFSELGMKVESPESEAASDLHKQESILSTIQRKVISNSHDQVYEGLDSSISISAHFSRFREVEGLHDYLLQQFNQDPSLKPQDVLVLCPDINAYASYVHAVFENQSSAKTIPFQVSGVSASANEVSSVLMSLIEMPMTRYELSGVVDLLNQPVVKARFELSTEEVEQIHGWFRQANAYWGLDKTTLTQLSLPEYDRYTLQAAVDRMVLGLSLDGAGIKIDDEFLYGLEGISALQSATLSKLINFMDALSLWRDVCIDCQGEAHSYTPSQWTEHLRGLTQSFIEVPYQELDSLNAWHQLLSGFEQGVIDDDLLYSYAFVRSQLNQAVEESAESSYAYRYGRTNIGSFGALKGIPAKVIAVLGLNEADFPRKPSADSINLTPKYPRLGDRNQTEQDKDAFLMAMLNCRSRFYCSYVGKDMRSNATRIPSLVLQELMDQIEPDVEKQNGLVIQHPMKAYSDEYFQDNAALYTFQNFHSQKSLLDQLGVELDGSLALPAWDMPEQITVQMLKAFLEDPAKAFFKTRFNVDLPDLEDDSVDEEPMAASPLTRWKFIDELLQQGLEVGVISTEMIATMALPYQASGVMEHDYFAEDTLEGWAETAASVLANALRAKENKQAMIQSVELNLNVEGQPLKLVGDINVFSDEGSSDIIQLVQKNGTGVSETYLMRTIVDTRIAEALKVEGQLNYSSSYLACQDKLYQLQADGQSGVSSLQTWLGLYKSVMNAPISLDITSAAKLNASSDYRGAFEQMLEDGSGSFSNMRLSKAMMVLSHDAACVDRGEAFVEHYKYLKPSKTPDEELMMPHWVEVEVEGEGEGEGEEA
jgi:exodeoxyribonuclease V gamma subunit